MHSSNVAVVIAVVTVLLLGACSSSRDETTSDPAQTSTMPTKPSVASTSSMPSADGSTSSSMEPSVTVTSTDARTEDAERWAATVPAFKEYWDVVNETYAAGGAPHATDQMQETMTGQMLVFWEKSFADWAQRERRFEGENVVTGASVDSVVLAPDSGRATIRFCVDMSGTRAFEASGDPLPKDGNFQEGMALLEWVDGRWKVSGFTPESGVVPSC